MPSGINNLHEPFHPILRTYFETFGGVRYVLGSAHAPSQSCAGWSGILRFENRCLINSQFRKGHPDASHGCFLFTAWLASFRRECVTCKRKAWDENVEVALEMSSGLVTLPEISQSSSQTFQRIFYSSGNEDTRSRELASVFAIQLLLAELSPRLLPFRAMQSRQLIIQKKTGTTGSAPYVQINYEDCEGVFQPRIDIGCDRN